jgi:enoyl-CoA hydratase/carnithine racemase
MTIKTAILNGVSTIEIARPEKKNALTVAMYDAMCEALKAADADASVRAVLITGQPGIFTSGNDLEDFMKHPPAGEDSAVFRFLYTLLNVEKPVVAAVTGSAVGVGVTMLMHCDFVYVADDAKLVMPFVALGLVPEFASSLTIPMAMGVHKASEKLMLGEPILPEEAVDFGVANAVLPPNEVVAHARRVAERFNNLPPSGVRETKKLMRAPMREATLAAMKAEGTKFAERLRGPEAREAFQAFFEKRKPDFKQFS